MPAKMQFHEYANLFPMMNDEEFAALVDDMRINGYDATAPITTYQGKILDGRNRYNASLEAGVNANCNEYRGADALSFVIRHNLKRRHLTPDQLAMVALDIEVIEAERARERQLSTLKQGNKIPVSQNNDQREKDKGKAAEKAARKVGASRGKVQRGKALAKKSPKLAEKVRSGEMSLKDAEKQVKQEEKKEQQVELVKLAEQIGLSDRWSIYQDNIETAKLEQSADAIITDPPYPKEYLPLWSHLARFAKENLKPGGVLLAMTPAPYLPEIMQMLGEHLTYQWIMACVLPGNHGSVIQSGVRNVLWKPILVYRNGGKPVNIGSDLFENDAPDKKFHDWGQGVGGYVWQIENFTKPNDLVCDPFLGGGTTAAASIQCKRRFVGFDMNAQKVAISKGRLGT